MAVNKNFVVKNGLEVNSNLLVADLDAQTVGIGTTIAPHELHVVGGIGVTNLNVTGVATIANLRITGPSTFVGVTTFTDSVFIQKDLSVNGTINIDAGSGGSIGTDLVIQRHVRAGGIVTFSDSLFVGSGLGQSTGTSGQVLQVAGVSSGAYFGGQVGIGTTNPAGGGAGDVALHVVGDSRFVGLTTFTGITTFQSDVSVQGSLKVTGDITYDEITGRNLNISGLATFQTLTAGRVALVGTGDTLTDDANLTFVKGGTQLVVGVGATVGGGLTASSVMVEDLTDNRVVIAGADGELEDSSNFVFDGSQLILGVGATVGGALTVAGATDLNSTLDVSGNVSLGSSLDVTGLTELGDVNVSAASTFGGLVDINAGGQADTFKVEDLTSGRVVLAGTGGELEDSGNLTFDGTQLVVTGVATVSGAMTAGSFSVGNNQVVSSARQLQNIASLDSTTTATIESAIANAPNTFDDIEVTGIATFKSTVKVEDLAPNRVVFVGAGDSLTDDANFTFDRSQLILGVGATVGGALTVAGEGTFASTVGIAESIFHIGDTNTSFGFPAADTFTVDTGGSERLRINSAGLVKVGGNETVSAATGIQIENAGAALLTLLRNDLTISDGNTLGGIDFYGNDGGSVQQVAKISAVADGTHGDDDKPTALVFQTTNDGAGSATEKLRITNGGLVGIGTDNPGTNLDVLRTSNDTGGIIVRNTNNSQANARAQVEISGGDNADGRLKIECNSTEHTFRQDGSGNLQIHNASAERLRITSGGDVEFKGNNGITSMSFDRSSNSLNFVDNAKATFGISSDLQIYHDGTNTLIENTTGNLYILDDNAVILGSATGTESYFKGVKDGAAELYHNNSKKFETTGAGVTVTGICSASGGFDIGIHSAGTSVAGGPVKILNFVGTGNTFAYDASTDTIDISIAGGSGGGSGVTETDTTVSTTNPTGVGSFATASFRSASVIAQINQLNTDFQVGRYLMIHDGTTVTVVEESAVSTGSTMLGSFTGVIDGSNVELRVTLASAGVSTVTTKIDTVTV